MQIIMTADAVLQITLVLPVYTSVTMCRYRGAVAVVVEAAEVIGEAEIAIVEDHHRRRHCQCKHQQISNDVDGINVCYYI